MIQCKHQILLSCWNILNSNFELELLRRSELTVQRTNAFNRILPMPRSTKYFPFFSPQLQLLCFSFTAPFSAAMSFLDESKDI